MWPGREPMSASVCRFGTRVKRTRAPVRCALSLQATGDSVGEARRCYLGGWWAETRALVVLAERELPEPGEPQDTQGSVAGMLVTHQHPTPLGNANMRQTRHDAR
jgi:hypothetical protein